MSTYRLSNIKMSLINTRSPREQPFGFSTYKTRRTADGLEGFRLISLISCEQLLLLCKQCGAMLSHFKETCVSLCHLREKSTHMFFFPLLLRFIDKNSTK